MRHILVSRGTCDVYRCMTKKIISIGDGPLATQLGFCEAHAHEFVTALIDGLNEKNGTSLCVVEIDAEDFADAEDFIAAIQGKTGNDPEFISASIVDGIIKDLETDKQDVEPSDDIPGLDIPEDKQTVPDTNVAKVEEPTELVPDFMKPDGSAEHPFDTPPIPKTIADPHNLVDLGSLADLTKEQLLEIVKTEGVKTRAASIEGLVIAITTHREEVNA